MPEFEHFVCWQRDRTFAVLNPDAEHVDDDIFLAAHTDLPLSLQETKSDTRPGLEARRWSMGFDEFLEQFLSPDRQHVQVVVLGDAGSGKSHFIHWLALHIPEQADRYVLSIPRSGLSLRGVIERVIDSLPDDQRAPYLERLDRSGFHMVGRDVQRSRILAEVALAIEADQPNDDAEEHLIAGLPLLFRDPNYATHLQMHGGIVDDLIAHISEVPGYERRDQRRRFDASDLPLEAINIGQLAARTRTFMAELRGSPDLVEPAIEIINRNLDKAIGQVLNFTGDQLIDLMRDLRRHLKSVRKTLILLIEDFARLQGVDYALLQALIESSASQDDLCEVRWAMAMTTGYYRRTADTVRTRMDFVIDMDLPTRGREAVFDDERILSFASRYLNTARLTGEQLAGWRAEVASGDPGEPPNACVPCQYRPRCHEAFGEVEGIGLYPFNRRAVLEMTSRVDPELPERFNPRLLIKGVLAEVLGNRVHEFDQKVFPSERFLEAMRGSTLPPIALERLERASPDFAKRQAAVLELWGVPGQLTAVDGGIYEAFGMPAPIIEGIAAPHDVPAPTRATEKSSVPDQIIEAVRAWGRGDPLAERVAAPLRDLLYGALVGYVDWDAAGIQQAWAASKAGSTPFRSRSIRFANQATNPSVRGVVLQVPQTSEPGELRQAAIAIEGLIEYQRTGSWTFQDAELKLIAVRRSLETWSNFLLAELRGYAQSDEGGDSVAHAIALLAIGRALAGDLEEDAPSLEKLANAIFEDWPVQSAATSPTWRRLFRDIRDQRDRLVELTRAWASGGKGGQVGAFLDASRLGQALKDVRGKWQLGSPSPEVNGNPSPDPITRTFVRTAQDLPMAVEEELGVVQQWLVDTRGQVPDGTGGRELQALLKSVREAASAAGLQVARNVANGFDESIEAFGPVLFDRAIQQAGRVVAEKDTFKVLPSLGSARTRAAMDATTRVITAADQLLAQVEASTSSREDDLAKRTGDVTRDREQIENALDRLSVLLQTLETAK